MSHAWSRAAAHAAVHHGVLSTSAADDLGIVPATLTAWVRAGRLHRPEPEAYVVAGTPDSWHQRAAIAVASSDAWASHRTAARLWGLHGFTTGRIEVLTAHGRRRGRTAWLIHETRHLRGVDCDSRDQLPCTSLARTLLDLPAVAHPFLVAQALDDACRRWPGTLEIVVQRFLELARRGRPGVGLMRALLAERLGVGRFAQSGFETSTLRLIRSLGLPDPVPQFRVRDGDFVAYIDLAWPHIRLGLECDSLAYHSGKRAHEWDRQRRRRLKLLGWELAEVTYDDVTKRRARTGEELRQLYRARQRAVGSGVLAAVRRD